MKNGWLSRTAARIVAVGVVSSSLAGCVTFTPGSATAPTATASAPTATAPTATETAFAPITTASAPVDTPPGTPAASPRSLAPRTSGLWSAIDWISGPPLTRHAGSWNPDFFGWSKGYLGFYYKNDTLQRNSADGVETIDVETSPNGLDWTPGATISTPAFRGQTGVKIRFVVEGPAGLLAAGGEDCLCSVAERSPVTRLWRSSDGIRWTQIDMPATFGSDAILMLAAGGVGYIARARTGTGMDRIWTSSDATHWHPSGLPGSGTTITGDQSVAAFAGGYVASRVETATLGGAQSYSLWSSADGSHWIREQTFNTTGGTVHTRIERISDDALVCSEWAYADGTPSLTTFVSTDGKKWRQLRSDSAVQVSSYTSTDGARGILVNQEPLQLMAYEDDLSLVALSQTGNVPPFDRDRVLIQYVLLGPAGLLAVVDESGGTTFYLGLPANS